MKQRGEILIVDDTHTSLAILTDVLAYEGYQVYPCDNGELALNAAVTRQPDLVLLDVVMPGMSGYDVCRQLKAQESTRHIPIIFLTALSDLSERIEGLRLGAVDFIAKPFQRDELLARVRTHLELSQLRNQLENLVVQRTVQLQQTNQQLQHEIAERKANEDKLRAAVAEREILLKEVHHRVKNNLAVVVSLLALKADLVQEPNVRQALLDSQQRVYSMAMVHEELYQSGNLAEIDFSKYLIRLVDRVLSMYHASNWLQRDLDIQPEIRLSVEKAIPLGQLANELLTNVLKHAFPQGNTGHLRVVLRREPHHLLLEIADDGVGLPKDIENGAPATVGMQIVQVLARQVGGKLHVQREPGTTFTLSVGEKK